MTRPLSPSGVTNGGASKVCAADGRIDERWEYVTGIYTFEAVSKYGAVRTRTRTGMVCMVCLIIVVSLLIPKFHDRSFYVGYEVSLYLLY